MTEHRTKIMGILNVTVDSFSDGGKYLDTDSAVKHGIAQALTKFEPVLRGVVKAAGFLTRDSRAVERKKYGRAKARKSFQFSKR